MATPCSSTEAAPAPWLTVLHEDDDILVVNKPQGLVCHPTKSGPGSSLIGRMRAHLGGVATPRLVHRLDRETGGVLVAAKTAEAASEWMALLAAGLAAKEYLAIVHGFPAEDSGLVDAPLGGDPSSAVKVKDCVRPDGAEARTSWRVAARWESAEGRFALLRVRPDTGRKHQIRIHMQHAGHPIVGDKLYGGDPDLYLAMAERRLKSEDRRKLLLPNHALHAARLWAPWRGREVEFCAAPGVAFGAFARGCAPAWAEDPYDHRLWADETAP